MSLGQISHEYDTHKYWQTIVSWKELKLIVLNKKTETVISINSVATLLSYWAYSKLAPKKGYYSQFWLAVICKVKRNTSILMSNIAVSNSISGCHSGSVVTDSPPTYETGVRILTGLKVAKMVVACLYYLSQYN